MTKKYVVRFIAALLVVAAVGTAAFASFKSSDNVDKSLVFSERTLLSGLWDNYKKIYWEETTGRTLDKQQNNITTSEGQSYTMLRAVWQSDRETFDKSWDWTKEHLSRPDDALFAWKWGKKADGTYGVFADQGGQNTASDADTDIALALIMAATKWQDQEYLDNAKRIVTDIWENEVIEVKGKPYHTANNLEKFSQRDAIINPSYLAPYSYRLFAKIDKDHDWNKVVDSSYEIIAASMADKLDKQSSALIVPNWIGLDQETGNISAFEDKSLTTDYGFDAMRTPFRLALDYKWNNEPRAKSTLERMGFLKKEWEEKGKISSTYAHDGMVLKDFETAEMYATSLGYFMVVDTEAGDAIYNTKLKPLYDQDKNSWNQEMTYYGDNWTWFGIALYDNKLDNIAKDLK
jgi:endoglucanase